MNSYPYSVFTRHVFSGQARTVGPLPSPYRFERQEHDSTEAGPSAITVVVVLVASLAVVGIVLALMWFAGDQGSTEQAIRTHCTRGSGLWSGCLPTR